MKKSKTLDSGINKKVLIDEDEFSDQTAVELICPTCNTNSVVNISDGVGNTDKFCKRCGCVISDEDDIIRHRQRLLPPDEPEPTATSIQYDFTKDVEIRHTVPVRGGFAELQKKGLKITDYHTTEKQ